MNYLISLLLLILGINIAYAESRIVTFESKFDLTNSQKVIEAKKAASELCNTSQITIYEQQRGLSYKRKLIESQRSKVRIKKVDEQYSEKKWRYTAAVDLKCI